MCVLLKILEKHEVQKDKSIWLVSHELNKINRGKKYKCLKLKLKNKILRIFFDVFIVLYKNNLKNRLLCKIYFLLIYYITNYLYECQTCTFYIC